MNGKISTIKRRRAIYDRYVSGDSVAKIAEEFGLAKTTVMGTISRLTRHEEEAYAKMHHQMRVRQTNLLEHASDELLNAWEKSKQLMERVVETEWEKSKQLMERVVETEQDSDGEWESVKERKTNGDAAYLREFRQCRQDISELWGLNAPTTQITTNVTAQQVEIRETIVVTRDDVRRARQIDIAPAIEENPHAITDAGADRGPGEIHGPLHELCEIGRGGVEDGPAEATVGGVLQPMADGEIE